MNRVLITGADGFIGSHLVEGLVRACTAVCAFVLYDSFNSRSFTPPSTRRGLDQDPTD